MNLRVPLSAGNFLTSCKPVSFSRRTLHHGVSKYIYIYIYIVHFSASFVQCVMTVFPCNLCHVVALRHHVNRSSYDSSL